MIQFAGPPPNLQKTQPSTKQKGNPPQHNSFLQVLRWGGPTLLSIKQCCQSSLSLRWNHAAIEKEIGTPQKKPTQPQTRLQRFSRAHKRLCKLMGCTKFSSIEVRRNDRVDVHALPIDGRPYCWAGSFPFCFCNRCVVKVQHGGNRFSRWYIALLWRRLHPIAPGVVGNRDLCGVCFLSHKVAPQCLKLSMKGELSIETIDPSQQDVATLEPLHHCFG